MRILLVEDDSAVAEMYRLRLAISGHDVEIASDGQAGLRSALARPPDLALLDIRLPRMDGLTLLAALRDDARCARVPVIVLSNYGERNVIERGVRLGALAHLIKSQTTPTALADTISALPKR
jgi:DNA-binding response OmpR family regulator